MSKEEIQAQVDKAIRTVLNNPSLVIQLESKLIDDLNIESIDLLDISSELEKTVGRELDFKELSKQVTAGRSARDMRVGDVVNYLHSIAG